MSQKPCDTEATMDQEFHVSSLVVLTQPPLRALLVDDEPLARARMRALLAQCKDPQVEAVAEAGTSAQARAWLRDNACDLLLLDVQMPGDDGLTLAATLRALPVRPWVVFVTAHNDEAAEARGDRRGLRGACGRRGNARLSRP